MKWWMIALISVILTISIASIDQLCIKRSSEASGQWVGHRHQSISLPEDSIYQLPGEWVNQDAQTIILSDLAGRYQVVSLVYAGCTQICPTIVATMQKIQADLPASLQDHVGFVLVSLTPNQDTPDVMQQFMEKHELSSAHWTFISGHPDDLRRVAMVLGVKYKPSKGNDVSHSNLFTILDETGRMVHQGAGLYINAPAAVATIERLISDH